MLLFYIIDSLPGVSRGIFCNGTWEQSQEMIENMVFVGTWFLWEHGLCGNMVFVGTWFLWEHGLCGNIVFVGTWFLLEHGFCWNIVFVGT